MKKHLSENKCKKFHVDILEKRLVLLFECQKATFHPIPGDFRHLCYSSFSEIGFSGIYAICLSPRSAFQKVFYGQFLRSIWKSDLKTYIASPKPKICIRISIDLVTSDDLDLSRGCQRLKKALRSIPDTTHAVSPALF